MRKLVFKPLKSVLPSFLISSCVCFILFYFGILNVRIVHVQKGVEQSLSDSNKDSLGELDKEAALAYHVWEDSLENNSKETIATGAEHTMIHTLEDVTGSSQKTNVKKFKKKGKKRRKPFKKLKLTRKLYLKSAEEVQAELSIKYDLKHLEKANNCTNWNVTEMPPYSRICKQKNIDKHVIITLFTTMHDSKKNHFVYENTIRLWAALGPQVRRILFVSSPAEEVDLVQDACALGWDVMTAPLCDRNNLPVLMAMFLAAQQVSMESHRT